MNKSSYSSKPWKSGRRRRNKSLDEALSFATASLNLALPPAKVKKFGFGGGQKQPSPMNRPGFNQYKPQAPMGGQKPMGQPQMGQQQPPMGGPRMQPGGFAPRESVGGGGRGPATFTHNPWNFQRAMKAADEAIKTLEA